MNQRILVIQLKRIGDFILTVPALAALRAERPAAELVLLAPEALVELARCLPWIHRVIGFKSGRLNAKAWLSALAGPWDACLDFTGNDRSALLTQTSRAKLRVGYQKFSSAGMRRKAYHRLSDASVRELHTVDFHQALVECFLEKPLSQLPAVHFEFPAALKAALHQKLRDAGLSQKYLILHPGTARVEKFWLDERWAEVARHVHEHMGLQVMLTGTGTGLEEKPLQSIKSQSRVPLVDMTGRLSLPEMALVIQEAVMVVGVDSMAMHLAALAARPQVALFGPTNPFHWHARHAKAITLQGGSGRPLAEFLPKAPPAPMNQISTAAVIDAMSALH